MDFLYLFFILLSSIQLVDSTTEIIVGSPFYLRARILDSRTASVQFEIFKQDQQRRCQMYKFTIRRNHEHPYAMPEQNLTFYSNSLELQQLPVGQYRVCAIICSEHLYSIKSHYQKDLHKNRSTPIVACVTFQIFRTHLLVLILYILVIVFLTVLQIVFSIRKRRIGARVQLARIEVENSLHKWRQTQSLSVSTDHTSSYGFLQNLITLPTSPVEHSTLPLNNDDQRPAIFHLESSSDQQT